MDYSNYPDNWLTEIRPRILKRSENEDNQECCEWCGAKNECWIWYHPSADIEPAMMNIWTQDWIRATDWYGGNQEGLHESPDDGYLVCLTIAHILDPSPMNCEDDNLAALCNTCHLRHDAKIKANNIKRKKLADAEKAGQLRLF